MVGLAGVEYFEHLDFPAGDAGVVVVEEGGIVEPDLEAVEVPDVVGRMDVAVPLMPTWSLMRSRKVGADRSDGRGCVAVPIGAARRGNGRCDVVPFNHGWLVSDADVDGVVGGGAAMNGEALVTGY